MSSHLRIESAKKLQVVFIRACQLTESDLDQMAEALKNNACVRVFDISSNQTLDPAKTVECIANMVSGNRSVEYLGLSKLAIETANLKPLFDNIGSFPFEGDVEER